MNDLYTFANWLGSVVVLFCFLGVKIKEAQNRDIFAAKLWQLECKEREAFRVADSTADVALESERLCKDRGQTIRHLQNVLSRYHRRQFRSHRALKAYKDKEPRTIRIKVNPPVELQAVSKQEIDMLIAKSSLTLREECPTPDYKASDEEIASFLQYPKALEIGHDA